MIDDVHVLESTAQSKDEATSTFKNQLESTSRDSPITLDTTLRVLRDYYYVKNLKNKVSIIRTLIK